MIRKKIVRLIFIFSGKKAIKTDSQLTVYEQSSDSYTRYTVPL